MTVKELILQLLKFPLDENVYGEDYEMGKYDPKPEYRDWGNPNNPDRGVYL